MSSGGHRFALGLGVVSLACGAVQVLGFAPFHLWPLSLAVAAGWIWCVHKASARPMFAWAFLFALGQYLAGVSWVYVSIHHFGGAPVWLAAILVVVLSAYLALYFALGMSLAWWLTGSPVPRLLLAAPAAWFLMEQGRGLVLGGFTWLSPGYALLDVPGGSGLLAVVGVMGLGVLFWVLAGAIALLFERRWQPALLVLFPLLLVLAWLPKPSYWTEPAVAHDGQAIQVALAQGNIPQEQKWAPDNLLPTLELYSRLTEQSAEADVVIWPEVAIPAARHQVGAWFDMWQTNAERQSQTVLAGIITRVDGLAYNTMYAIGDTPGRYVKQHLVPFGEYFPVPGWMRPVFDWLDLPFSDIRTDLDSDRLLFHGDIGMAISICFEDLFPSAFAQAARGSGLLVNVTNDAWFRGSLAPDQHLQIARARAAENGRPLLRAANTGISASIGPDGEILDRLEWGQRGRLEVSVQARQGNTPFARLTNRPLFLLACLILLGLAAYRIIPVSQPRHTAPSAH